MPVYKYKTFAHAEAHLQELLPSDPAEKIMRMQNILRIRGAAVSIQRGVHKFKSFAEAEEHRKGSSGSSSS